MMKLFAFCSPSRLFLQSKEDQVEELLARADNLVTQQKPPDVVVYEAMAESLGTTWKELNRQLLMRGFLLEETLKFYTLAEKHAKVNYINQIYDIFEVLIFLLLIRDITYSIHNISDNLRY